MSNKGYKQYIKKLKQGIPREFNAKKQFLASVSGDIGNYIEAHPIAAYEDICVEFGTPEEVVHSLMDNLEANQMNEILVGRKRAVCVLSVAVICLLLFLFVVIPSIPIRTTDTVYIYETESMEDE